MVATATKADGPQSIADLKALLRQAGLRSTGPRLAVLRLMQQASVPVSHGELAAQLESEGMDRTTVYRNLVDLAEVGLLQRTDLGDHVWRFEFTRRTPEGDAQAHPHFTCTDCGTVACLPEVTLKLKSIRGVPRSLARKSVAIQLRGQCDDCAPDEPSPR